MEEIEHEVDKRPGVTSVRSVLDQAERGGAVGPDTAQLPVEIGLSRRQQRDRRADRWIFICPVEPVRSYMD